MNKQDINLIEQEVQQASFEQAMSHKFTKRSHDRRFDAWEAKVDEEIRQYLEVHKGDQYDLDGSIYSKAQKWVDSNRA